MGADKALLQIEGVAMARRVAAALERSGAAPVAAIGGNATSLAALGLAVVPDRWPGQGPLGGVATALGWSPEPLVVVAGCDQPWLDPLTIDQLVDAHAARPSAVAAVTSVDGVVQPLPGLYARRCLRALDDLLTSGRRALHEALRLGPLALVPLAAGDAVRDVDRPGDLPDHYDHPVLSQHWRVSVDIPEIDVVELARRHGAGATVIDVRQPDEYAAGHVPGARLIPLAEIPERVDEVPAQAEVLVICKSGGRSRSASKWLRAQGIDAVNVAGGTTAWIEAGQPVVSGDRPT